MKNSDYQVKVKFLGPIHEGFISNDGFFPLSKLNVFIGEQGSGKSTIVKLVSTLLWLEKAFVREEQDYKTFNTKDLLNLCHNQRIDSYFSDKTYFSFVGDVFTLEYSNSKFVVIKTKQLIEYKSKKIMYIPSERNFISVVEDAQNKSGLPYTIINTLEEFLKASKALEQNKIKLPLNGYEYFYDKTGKTGFIHDQITGSTVKLSESSSGLQSFVPVFIISNYLANNVMHDFFDNLKNFSLSTEIKQKILLLIFIKMALMKKKILSFRNSKGFINRV